MRYLFLVPVFLFFGCNKEIKEAFPVKTNPNLSIYGYTLVDVGWDDPTDREKKDSYIDEVKDFSNVCDILAYAPDNDLREKMLNIQNNGLKAMIHISELFFELKETGGDRGGAIYGLRSDWQARWDEFVLLNDLPNQAERISCLYLGEEPNWNSIPENEFSQACSAVKSTMPITPILLIEASGAINYMYIPNNVDWVGFDHYFLKRPAENSTFLAELQNIKSKLTPSQKMLLVMDCHWIKQIHGSAGIARKDMDVVARDYYNIANSDTTIIGVLGYFWPGGFDNKHAKGTRNLPKNVLAEHKRIGKMITGK